MDRAHALTEAFVDVRDRSLRAVEAEEELDGPIPPDMFLRCATPEGVGDVLRAAVRATKKGIVKRILAEL